MKESEKNPSSLLNQSKISNNYLLDNSKSEQSTFGFRLYSYRFVIILSYCIITVSNGLMWVTFIPNSVAIASLYKVNIFWVNFMSLLYMILYIPVGFLANYIMDKSLRISLSVGIIFSIVGAWTRTLINSHFYYAIIGQSLASFGQPFILNSPAMIAATWFPPESRTFVTIICGSFNLFGCSIGFIIHTLFFSNDTISTLNFLKYVQFEAILVSVGMLTLFTFRNKPPSPPSKSMKMEKLKFIEGFKHIFTHCDFIFLLFSSTLFIGSFNSFSTLVNVIFEPFGTIYYNDATIEGFIIIGVGAIIALLIGKIIDLTKLYKIFFSILQLICSFTFLVLGAILHYQSNIYIVRFCCGILGGALSIVYSDSARFCL